MEGWDSILSKSLIVNSNDSKFVYDSLLCNCIWYEPKCSQWVHQRGWTSKHIYNIYLKKLTILITEITDIVYHKSITLIFEVAFPLDKCVGTLLLFMYLLYNAHVSHPFFEILSTLLMSYFKQYVCVHVFSCLELNLEYDSYSHSHCCCW